MCARMAEFRIKWIIISFWCVVRRKFPLRLNGQIVDEQILCVFRKKSALWNAKIQYNNRINKIREADVNDLKIDTNMSIGLAKVYKNMYIYIHLAKGSVIASFHPYFDLPNRGTEISRMFPFRSNGFVLINDDGRYAMPQFIENVNQKRSWIEVQNWTWKLVKHTYVWLISDQRKNDWHVIILRVKNL